MENTKKTETSEELKQFLRSASSDEFLLKDSYPEEISDSVVLHEVLAQLDNIQIQLILNKIGWNTLIGKAVRAILAETGQISKIDNTGFNSVQDELRAELKSNPYYRREFFEEVLHFIDRIQKTDAQVYNEIGMNRALWYRLRDNRNARTNKRNILKLTVALRLDYFEAFYLINLAGYSFMINDKTDHIIGFCLARKIYDASKIDDLLVQNGENVLFSEEE